VIHASILILGLIRAIFDEVPFDERDTNKPIDKILREEGEGDLRIGEEL